MQITSRTSTAGSGAGNFREAFTGRCVPAAGCPMTGLRTGTRPWIRGVNGIGAEGFMRRHPDTAAAHLEGQRLDRLPTTAKAAIQKVDLVDIPLETAKLQVGAALRTTIRVTGSALKEFGDPSQVNRVCDGEIPSVIARMWARPQVRKELIKSLADASGQFTVSTNINEKVG